MTGRVPVAALAVTLVLVAVLAACGGDDKDVVSGAGDGSSTPAAAVKAPSDDPSVTGIASKVTSTGFVVQDGKDPSGTTLAATVRVPAKASVLRASASGYTKASLDDVRDGATVQVWFTGPVAESYPVQATAGTVVITG